MPAITDSWRVGWLAIAPVADAPAATGDVRLRPTGSIYHRSGALDRPVLRIASEVLTWGSDTAPRQTLQVAANSGVVTVAHGATTWLTLNDPASLVPIDVALADSTGDVNVLRARQGGAGGKLKLMLQRTNDAKRVGIFFSNSNGGATWEWALLENSNEALISYTGSAVLRFTASGTLTLTPQDATTGETRALQIQQGGAGGNLRVWLQRTNDAKRVAVFLVNSLTTAFWEWALVENSSDATFSSAAGEVMRLTASGNVAIGTSSALARLNVGGSVRATPPDATAGETRVFEAQQGGAGGHMRLWLQRTNDAKRVAIFLVNAASTAYWEWALVENGGVLNLASAAVGTVIQCTQDGKVGVRTAPSNTFDVVAAAGANSTLATFWNQTADSSAWGPNVRVGTNTSGVLMSFQRQDGTTIGSISHNGTNVSYNTSSDPRLKTLIGPTTRAGLAALRQLPVYDYRWNDKPDGPVETGVLASDVATVLPEASTTLGPENLQMVDYGRLSVLALAACKELDTAVTALTARVAALERRGP